MPVIIFEGSENFLKQHAVTELRSKLGLTMLDDPNVLTAEAAGFSFEDLVMFASATPFLSASRLVCISGLLDKVYPKGSGNKSSRGRGKSRSQGGWDPQQLWRYLDEDLPESTTVLLIEDALPAGKLQEELHSVTEIQSFYPLSRSDVQTWISRRVVERQSAIEPAALSRLAELYKPLVGGARSEDSRGIGLRQLDQEIEKLCVYSGGERPIGPGDVAAFIEMEPEANIFRFVDAVYEGRLVPALNLLELLLAGGKEPWYLYNMLAREARLLVGAHYMVKDGASHSDIRLVLGLSPRAPLDSLLRRARRMSEGGLQRNYDLLIESDMLRKRSSVYTERMLVEQLTEDLCSNVG